MKFKIEWIVILGLLIWIAVQQCSKPEPVSIDPDREMQYKRQAAIDKIEKDSIQALQTKQNKQAQERVKKDSIKIALQNKEIRALKVKAAKATAAIPPEALLQYPEVKTALDLKDSVNMKLTEQNDSLKSSLEFHSNLNQELIGLEYQEDKIEAQMLIDCERSREELKRENQQLRKPKLTLKGFLKKLRNYTIAGAIGAAAVKVADELKD